MQAYNIWRRPCSCLASGWTKIECHRDLQVFSNYRQLMSFTRCFLCHDEFRVTNNEERYRQTSGLIKEQGDQQLC
jgi:hypothetical protein